MLANLDYLVELPDGTIAILECKTTSYFGKDKWENNFIPVNYEIQARHYMCVMNINKVFYACLYGNNDNQFLMRELDRDYACESELIFEEQVFWNDYVLKKQLPPFMEEPELVAACLDAMTGIVPEHRGKGLFSQLFEHTKNRLKNSGVTHYYLEVITTNENAYSIYKKKGGKVDREFSVLEGKMNRNLHTNTEVIVSPLSAFSKEDLSKYEPSFGNRVTALRRNIENYQIAYVEAESKKLAVVFSKQGRIPQIMWDGIDSSDLLYTVLTHLSHNFESLSISNIPITETKLINELLNNGFRILVNQYEMCIEL